MNLYLNATALLSLVVKNPKVLSFSFKAPVKEISGSGTYLGSVPPATNFEFII